MEEKHVNDEDAAATLEERLAELEAAERALDAADAAAGADRAKITQAAQLDAAEAVAYVGIAMESDAEAAEAARLARIAERTGEKTRAKAARSKERVARKKAKADHKMATKSARNAYNAVRFSDPNSLGFLRVILVVLVLNVVFTSVMLATMIKDSFVFDFGQSLNLIKVLLDGISAWLIWKHKELARPWVLVVCAANVVLGTAFNLIVGSFDLFVQLPKIAFDVFMVVYFATSSRVKATLVEPFNTRTLNDDLDEEESYFRPTTWEFWRNLVVYFVVFSIVGHWMEAAVCLLIKYGIVPGTYDPTSQIWSDWLYPFPVYGIGFCACALLFYPLKNWLQRKFSKTLPALAMSFVVSAIVCSLIELSMGLATNQDLQLWDYSDMFCNFMGQICLQNALFFGLVATIMTWLVYPALERQFRRIPNEAGTGVFIVAVVGWILLYALYYVNLSPSADSAIGEAAQAAQEMEFGTGSSSAKAGANAG